MFCAAFIPLFLAWRSAISGKSSFSIQTWALVSLGLGTLYTVVRYYFGPLFQADYTITSFWYQLFDMTAFPAALPVAVSWALYRRRAEERGLPFSLLWLSPLAIAYALRGPAITDRASLVYFPLLWTALSSGLAFIASEIRGKTIYIKICLILSLVVLPLIAALSSWLFHVYYPTWAIVLLVLCWIPEFIDIILRFLSRRTAGPA